MAEQIVGQTVMAGKQYTTFHNLIGYRIGLRIGPHANISESGLTGYIPGKDNSGLYIPLLEKYLHFFTGERSILAQSQGIRQPAR